jgi:excinuclease ABC subunit C
MILVEPKTNSVVCSTLSFTVKQLKRLQIVVQNRPYKGLPQMQKTCVFRRALDIEVFERYSGTNPVAACVVFKGGPSKKDYRHFNNKNSRGPDDFASMI